MIARTAIEALIGQMRQEFGDDRSGNLIVVAHSIAMERDVPLADVLIEALNNGRAALESYLAMRLDRELGLAKPKEWNGVD